MRLKRFMVWLKTGMVWLIDTKRITPEIEALLALESHLLNCPDCAWRMGDFLGSFQVCDRLSSQREKLRKASECGSNSYCGANLGSKNGK